MLEKLKKELKKEIFYYLLTFIILALIFHFDLLSNPVARFDLMLEKENYSHPFIYSFVVYGVILIIRKTIDFIVGLFQK